MSPQLDTNYDIDNETGAVIPDLLKLQSKPLAEMNPWQSKKGNFFSYFLYI